MPLSFLIDLFTSLLELVKASLIVSVPAFLIVAFAYFLHKRLTEKFKFSWIKSSFISTYLTVFLLIIILYVYPLILAGAESQVGIVPEEFQPTFQETGFTFALSALQILFSAFVFTVLLIPFEFLSVFVLEKLTQRFKWHWLINFYVSTFVSVAVAILIVLFLFPWIPAGLIYLVYWGIS